MKIKLKKLEEVLYRYLKTPENLAKPSKKAEEWAKNNPWFIKEGWPDVDDHPIHKAMTANAYGLHTKAVANLGLKVDSDDYYNYIDRKMRKSFPKYAWTYDVPEQESDK